MIIGLGTDVVDIARLERVVERRGAAFLDRVYTADEQAFCHRHRRPGPSLAARWAAKEACMKALGTGWAAGVTFVDIEIRRDGDGRPDLYLHRRTASLAEKLGMRHAHVSLSHDHGIAMATVILEG